MPTKHKLTKFFQPSDEVSQALERNLPIVALESTIITHGMPFPENYNLAIKAKKILLEEGVTPAVIALIGGRIKIGLSDEEIRSLAKDNSALKLSSRDILGALIRKKTGSTTVAATMLIAHLSDIPVFATGGIGGVHRNVEKTCDVSADLYQFLYSPICVICAGPKAILDIPKTLEVLETLGISVTTFKSDYIPAFWSVNSGIKTPERVNSIRELVEFQVINQNLGHTRGQLICNPIPKKDEIPKTVIEPIITRAIEESELKNISGKALTPFLLKKILEETKGKSLEANKALLLNNVKLASKIAFLMKKR